MGEGGSRSSPGSGADPSTEPEQTPGRSSSGNPQQPPERALHDTGSRPPALVLHDTGRGPSLVLLHAFPLDASQWDHQVAALSGDFRCVRPDMWGCGESPELPEPLLATLDGYAAALLLCLDAAGVGDFVAVGASMGGYAALAVLRLAPERVRALVLAASRPTADTPEQAQNRRKMAELALRDGAETAVPMVKRLLGPGSRNEPHIADPVVGRIRRCRPAGIAACQAAMACRPDSTAMLGSVGVPALVIQGDQDAIVGLDEARATVASLPRGELQVIPGVGHLANLEDPPAFTGTLRDFLDRIG